VTIFANAASMIHAVVLQDLRMGCPCEVVNLTPQRCVIWFRDEPEPLSGRRSAERHWSRLLVVLRTPHAHERTPHLESEDRMIWCLTAEGL
jgi:hypothetical protein